METIQSDILHLNKFIAGVESLKENHHTSVSDLSNVERYTIGVMKADGVKFDIHSGNEGFIANAGKKIWEVIKRIFAKIAQTCKMIKQKIKNFLIDKKIIKNVEGIKSLRHEINNRMTNDKERTRRYKDSVASFLKNHSDLSGIDDDNPITDSTEKFLKEIFDADIVDIFKECVVEYKPVGVSESRKMGDRLDDILEHISDNLDEIQNKVGKHFSEDKAPLAIADAGKLLQATLDRIYDKGIMYVIVYTIDDLENKR